MTRKRFCKKLMGLGASRNYATKRASMLTPGRSYDAEYVGAAFGVCVGRMGSSAKRVSRALRKLSKAAEATTLSASEFVPRAFYYPTYILGKEEIGVRRLPHGVLTDT